MASLPFFEWLLKLPQCDKIYSESLCDIVYASFFLCVPEAVHIVLSFRFVSANASRGQSDEIVVVIDLWKKLRLPDRIHNPVLWRWDCYRSRCGKFLGCKLYLFFQPVPAVSCIRGASPCCPAMTKKSCEIKYCDRLLQLRSKYQNYAKFLQKVEILSKKW